MRDIFDDFCNDIFALGFGTPSNLKFGTSGTKDMYPVNWKKTNNGFIAVCRTVGISPDDVEVKLVDNNIVVSGYTKTGEYEYNTYYELPVSDDILSNITDIKYKTQDGITYIYLKVQRPEKRALVAQKID